MTWRPEWEERAPTRFGFGGDLRALGAARWIVIACAATTLFAMVLFHQFGIQVARGLGLSVDHSLWLYPWLTYVFPHDVGSPWHVIVNGVMIWMLGGEIEQRLGRGRFLTLFFGAALVGAAAHVAAQALFGSLRSPMIGASGGVFGLLFFIARETPHRPFIFYLVPIPAWVLAGLYVILETFPLLVHGVGADGVAHLCHLGGAAFGFWYVGRAFDATRWLDEARARAAAAKQAHQAARAHDDDVEMDRILEKIHREGMPSLTDSERRFLERRSQKLRDRD